MQESRVVYIFVYMKSVFYLITFFVYVKRTDMFILIISDVYKDLTSFRMKIDDRFIYKF